MSDYRLIAADMAQMEIRVFAHFSGDTALQQVFKTGDDFYSRVAIDVFDRPDLSANPTDRNFLKKIEPNLRQLSKIFALSTIYGAGGYQVAAGMGYLDKKGKIDSARGDKLIHKYLTTYPNLKKYMIRQELALKKQGYVENQFGRIRRFDEAFQIYKKYGDGLEDYLWCKRNGLMEERKTFNNAMNAAKNFPIQSTAASVINRAMIELTEWLQQAKVDARIILQVHDECCLICHVSCLDIVSEKLKYYMENNKYALALSVAMEASPVIADNLGDAK